MEVKAINTINFQGRNSRNINNKKQSIENDFPQMDTPMDKNSAEAMRNLVLGLMAVGATVGGL